MEVHTYYVPTLVRENEYGGVPMLLLAQLSKQIDHCYVAAVHINTK